MKKKKVAAGICVCAAAIGILCIVYTGCRKEPKPGQEEVLKETVEVKTREELPEETKDETPEEQKEEPKNLALEEKEAGQSEPKEPVKKESASAGETKKVDEKEEAVPEEVPKKLESVPETPPAAETPAPEPGFDVEQEAILFARINESRGGDLLEGTWAKNKAREKAKAQDGSGVLFGYNTTGDAAHMAEKLIASYGSTIGMGWKSFGCGGYQSGGTYYYCVVFDTMTN